MKKHYLKDYQPPHYFIDEVKLEFHLNEKNTQVKSILSVRKNSYYSTILPLELDGEALKLISVTLEQKKLSTTDYQLDAEKLVIPIAADVNNFTLEIETEINPIENTALSGLYISRNMFCTQCEANGFRRITYFIDRPDVMSVYTTTIIADKKQYPVLLSNGNLIEAGDSKTNVGQHKAIWHDPFPKPCYLFALVAGDLAVCQDKFTTQSNREVTLNLYIEKGNEDKCQHALLSLKKAMRWDEEEYGREYDLDLFNIVAVSDFNMGAMENKSLNLFNAKYILAKSETATDADFEAIESVIAHEYFHNWTGNRITCRDWFQLSLKEGLTVFRDQEFSRDMNSRDVNRIHDVNNLRTYQFAEDAGPTAHPVMPDSYIEIDNFYTATVYNKGAEVIRMMQTLVGTKGFRQGMDLYFSRYDGQAVTIEELISSVEEANKIDLQQFRLWYSQAGTPQLDISAVYDEDAESYQLTVNQSCVATPEEKAKNVEKKPFHMPLKIALLAPNGETLQAETVLEIKQEKQQFLFKQIKTKPVPSLLRDFSAPVKLNFAYSDEDLIFLLMHDTNGVSRWEAGQKLIKRVITKAMLAYQQQQSFTVPDNLIATFRTILQDDNMDQSLQAELLTIPAEHALLSELMSENGHLIDVDALCSARQLLINTIAEKLSKLLLETYYGVHQAQDKAMETKAIARRKLKNLCLSYFTVAEKDKADAKPLQTHDGVSPEEQRDYIQQYILHVAFQQFETAGNMTDEIAALSSIVNLNRYYDFAKKEEVLEQFYKKWSHDDLVLDKWFSVQARARTSDALAQVKKLMQHPKFSIKNPNKVRALIGVFSNENVANFHDISGVGYEFLTAQIAQLNAINPQIAARLLTPLLRWKKFDSARQDLMGQQLISLSQLPNLSKDVGELVEKALQS